MRVVREKGIKVRIHEHIKMKADPIEYIELNHKDMTQLLEDKEIYEFMRQRCGRRMFTYKEVLNKQQLLSFLRALFGVTFEYKDHIYPDVSAEIRL
jgi:hypothetical protein